MSATGAQASLSHSGKTLPGQMGHFHMYLKRGETIKGSGCRPGRLYAKRWESPPRKSPASVSGQESTRDRVERGGSEPASLCFGERQHSRPP